MVGLQLREAVLARGDVDAILGFDSTMFFGLQKAGIGPDDIRFLYYSDAGLDLYGNGIMVSQKLRTENPDAVKRFVAVTARAWQAAIADPDAAVAALQKQSPLINAPLETAEAAMADQEPARHAGIHRRRPRRRQAGAVGEGESRRVASDLRTGKRAEAGGRVRQRRSCRPPICGNCRHDVSIWSSAAGRSSPPRTLCAPMSEFATAALSPSPSI